MGLSVALLVVLILFVLVELHKFMLTFEKFGGDLGFAKVHHLPSRLGTLCSEFSLDTGGVVYPLLFSAEREGGISTEAAAVGAPIQLQMSTACRGRQAHSRVHRRHRGRHCWCHRRFGSRSPRLDC